MSKIYRVGELFEQHTESRGTISAKYGEQGNHFSKIRRAGKIFQQNTESRGAISEKYGE